MDFILREMTKDEYILLDDFLYEAIYQGNETELVPKSIIEKPELQVYIANFNEKADDYCICAELQEKIVGAVWVRNINGYGSVDDYTIELAISLYKEYRRYGIGTALMEAMHAHLRRKHYKKVSLAVQKLNYAFHMYEKLGFYVIDENEEEYIMVCDLV